MKLKINTELEILDGKAKNVIDRFGLTKDEISSHIKFYFNHETLTSYSDIIVQLINDNRLDVVCCLASAYLMTTDKSVQPPDVECPECGGTGDNKYTIKGYKCGLCNGTGKVKS